MNEILFYASAGATFLENAINCVIFLESSHRFYSDPECGEIMGRIRMGIDTREDHVRINERVIGNNGVELPHNTNSCYECSLNKERNGVTCWNIQNNYRLNSPLC